MNHASSTSPEPPDGAHDIATGEDSQESATLQNAMQPLPDTQPDSQDYQQFSTENQVTIAAPTISRPAQPDADDLSIGFTYDKPAAVVPGQFSGRKHKKPINPIVEVSVAGYGPGISKEAPLEQAAAFRGPATKTADPAMPPRLSPQGRGPVPEPMEVPAAQNTPFPIQDYQAHQAVQSYQRPQITEDIPTPVPLPRKNHPFVDYQPDYRALGPQKQIPTPATSLEAPPAPDETLDSPSEHDLASNKGADVQQGHQRHPMNPVIVDISQKKSRTSLQNDVSVSSARPPRALPGSSPRTAMVNRPVKDSHRRTPRLSTPATRPRSGGSIGRSGHSIVKSNSKAKRAPHSVQASSSSRSSSRCAHHDEETPSMRHQSKLTPTVQAQERFHQKMATTATDLACCFNDKFADIQAEVDQHLQTIYDLKNGMSKQRSHMSRYKECIIGKDNKILKLEENCDQLLAKVESTNQELDARSSKISKLEQKCRSYKDFLNNAIAEQQELYKATKARCDGTITELRAEESKRNALQEHERKKTEVTREKLHQLVQSTVTECKQKEREFNNQIEVLKQRVQERDTDVAREREKAQALLQQNGSINSIQDTLKTFGVQIEEVVGKVNEVVAQQYQQDDQSAQDINVKLDQVMQYLRVLDERTLPTAELSKEMQELNEKTVARISEKLEPILAAQLQTKTGLDALCSGIETCMNDIWLELEDRQAILEEYCLEQVEAEREQVELLRQEKQEVERELDGQNQLFLQSERSVRNREAIIDKLQLDIAGLARDREQHAAESQHLDRLREECARLKDDSATKASLVAELEIKLQESTAKLATEEQKHQEKSDELQQLMEQRVAEAKAAQVQAVEAAQHDAMLRMNEIKADIDARLTQALEQRTALQQELDEAKQKATTIEAESSKMAEQATALGEELRSFQTEAAKDREQASVKEAEQQAVKEQQLKHIQDLQAQLATAEGKFSKLAGNAKSYDRAAQTILLSLRQWTQNYATIQTMVSETRKDSDKNGVLDQIDPRYKPLVELQLLQTAVSQYCQAQKEAAQMLSGKSVAVTTAPQAVPTVGSLEIAAGRVLDRLRRVTVRSPASNASSPQPPSVQVEQERRRMRERPKSILKLIPPLTQSSDEESRRDLLSNTSMNRGPYNRLVAGRNLSLPAAPFPQQGHSGSDSSVLEQEPGVAQVASETRKREQDSEQGIEQESARKRRSSRQRDKSTKPTPGFSSPAKLEVNGSQFDSVLGAPRTAGWRSTVNDEPMSSSAHSQSFHEQSHSQPTTNAFRIRTDNLFNTRSRPFQSSSNDPLALFYERRRSTRAKQESQESLVHSQDLGDRGDREFPISRRSNSGP